MKPRHMNDNGVSVIICCYNGAERLPQTLKYLALQQVQNNIPWEIILVDNASTDNTVQTAKAEWARYTSSSCSNFSITTELKRGKAHALELAIKQSAYEFIIICDDDNWLQHDYINKVHNILQSNPGIGIIGGQSKAVADVPIPQWFKNVAHSYAVGKQGTTTGIFKDKRYLWGAGMGFKRSLYIKAYAKIPALLGGPEGDLITRGEDVEFCIRVLFMGYELFYDEGLVFEHYMTANRLSTGYRDKFIQGNAYETMVLNLYYKQLQLMRMSLIEKLKLSAFSFTRLFVAALYKTGRWKAAHEREVLHLLTGIIYKKNSAESKLIHHVYLQLSLLTK